MSSITYLKSICSSSYWKIFCITLAIVAHLKLCCWYEGGPLTACTLYVKGFSSRVYCPKESLKESLQGQDKAVTCKGADKDFAPSCPRGLRCDHWEILCMPLYARCLVAVLPALNARSLVTGLTSRSLCNNKQL